MPITVLYVYVCVQVWKGRREDVCAGEGMRIREISFPMLFAVANIKPGRSKKTISENCYVCVPGWDRNQEVRIRKEAEYYTKGPLSLKGGTFSAQFSPLTEGMAWVKQMHALWKNFRFLLSAPSPFKTSRANPCLPLVLPTGLDSHIQGSKGKNRTLKGWGVCEKEEHHINSSLKGTAFFCISPIKCSPFSTL